VEPHAAATVNVVAGSGWSVLEIYRREQHGYSRRSEQVINGQDGWDDIDGMPLRGPPLVADKSEQPSAAWSGVRKAERGPAVAARGVRGIRQVVPEDRP
jgi:hypothetical protein